MKIKINPKPPYKRAKGHPPPLSGGGPHQDKRTKRKRGGKAADRNAIKDQN